MISPIAVFGVTVASVASYWLQEDARHLWFIAAVVLISPFLAIKVIRSIYFVYPWSREAVTLAISWFSVKWPKRLRRNFERDFQIPRYEASGSHPHPVLATQRSAAIDGLRVFASNNGLQLYSVGAGRDELGVRRSYWWSTDVTIQPRIDPVPRNQLRVMTFVDFHIQDLADILVDPVPTGIVTIVPLEPCGAMSEVVWTFKEGGFFEMLVRGGGTFRHQLWDYSTDVLSFYTPSSWSRLWAKFTTYAVSVKRVSPLTVVVFLDPQSSVQGVAASLAAVNLEHNRLKRMQPVTNGVAMLKSFGAVPTISVGLVDTHVSATLPMQTWEAMQSQCRVSSHAISLGIVKSFMDKMGVELRPQSQIVMVEALRHIPHSPQAVPHAKAVRVFSTSVEDDPVHKFTVHSSPVIHGAFAPANNPSMSAAAVVHRLLEFRGGSEWDPFTDDERGFVIEFTDYVASKIGKLTTYDAEVIVEKQRTMAKKMLLHNAMVDGGVVGVCSSFVKNESYGKITDPRIITTFPQVNKMEYAAFMLAIGEAFKIHLPYYGFLTPLDVATKVASIYDGAEVATLGDASRMDGHVPARVRAAEWFLLRKLFHRTEWKELRNAVNAACCRKAFMAHNSQDPWLTLLYVLLFERGSGSMETSPMNTTLTASMHWTACRIAGFTVERTAKFMDTQLIVAGDDSAAANLPAYALLDAGKIFGMDMKVDTVERGGFGVNFLNRWYTRGVWYNDIGSFTDVTRALAKYHLTTGKLTTEEWALSRWTAYSRSDRITPVIGDLVRCIDRVIKVNGYSFKPGQNLDRPFLRCEDEDFDWPQTPFCETDAYEVVQRFLVDFDFASFKDWARDVQDTGSLEDFLNPPTCMKIESTHARYVELDTDGYPVDGAGPQFPLPAPPSAAETKLGRRTIWKEVEALEAKDKEEEAGPVPGNLLSAVPILLAPFWEEPLKMNNPVLSMFLIAQETYFNVRSAGWARSSPALVMHVGSMACYNVFDLGWTLPFWFGAHLGVNILALRTA